MAGQSKTTTAARRKPPAPKPADARDALSVADLARGILSKEIRPRAAGRAPPRRGGDRRRREAEEGQEGRRAGHGGKKKDKSKKKLAKIPGQQARNSPGPFRVARKHLNATAVPPPGTAVAVSSL